MHFSEFTKPYNYMIKKAVAILYKKGPSELIKFIFFYIIRRNPHQAKSFSHLKYFLKEKIGFEIGGPSAVFMKNGIFPVYQIADRIDNCNFRSKTIWEGNIKDGQTFFFNLKKAPGRQFFSEATDLDVIESDSYDFILSSHVLEHCANPILALSEWTRLLKENGLLIIFLPRKDHTFDHRRPITTMEHLISDFITNIREDDLTHMPEILALHDLELDHAAGDFDSFKSRSLQNFENRCFHHHVFDTELIAKLVDYMNLQIIALEIIPPIHLLIVAKKISKELINNSIYTFK